MGLSPLTFTGISKYSTDFQTILDRAQAIANIPVQQLQNQQLDLVTKKQLLTDLRGAVANASFSIKNLGNIGAHKGLEATSSDLDLVMVTNAGATAPATYTISEITSIAKAAGETSASGYASSTATTVSASGSVRLVVGTNTYNKTLTAGENNLQGIRDWINGLNAGVTASVITTNTGATPNYLSISASETGAKTLELREDPGGANTQLLTTTNQGANAKFKLNGIQIERKTNLVNDVISGLTFTLLEKTDPAETVTLTLASERNQIATALQSFVSTYNAVNDQLKAQIGENAGLLSGDFLIGQTKQLLRETASYQSTSSGSIKSLTDLGIEFDSSGVASFNQTTFDKLSDTAINDAFTFLGSETTGFGGLSAKFTQISDPLLGLIKTQQDKYDESDRRISEQVAALIERNTRSQKSLQQKLQYADSMLGQLESQQNVLDASLQSLSMVLFGKKDE